MHIKPVGAGKGVALGTQATEGLVLGQRVRAGAGKGCDFDVGRSRVVPGCKEATTDQEPEASEDLGVADMIRDCEHTGSGGDRRSSLGTFSPKVSSKLETVSIASIAAARPGPRGLFL